MHNAIAMVVSMIVQNMSLARLLQNVYLTYTYLLTLNYLYLLHINQLLNIKKKMESYMF